MKDKDLIALASHQTFHAPKREIHDDGYVIQHCARHKHAVPAERLLEVRSGANPHNARYRADHVGGSKQRTDVRLARKVQRAGENRRMDGGTWSWEQEFSVDAFE